MKSSHRAWLALALFSTVNLLFGRLLAGREGTLWSLTISLSIIIYIHTYAEIKILRHFRGKAIEGEDPWGITSKIKKLSLSAKVRIPNALIIDTPSPQAYVFGMSWKRSHIVLTSGLLERLENKDIEAILAYCLASIQRQNIFSQLVATTFVSFLTSLTSFLDHIYRWLIGLKGEDPYFHNYPFTFCLSPFVLLILRLIVPESQYKETDLQAANSLSSPRDLAVALWKLESYRLTLPLKTSPALAHGYVVNPLTNKGWYRYFCSHPSIQKRIENLVGHYPI